VRHSGLVSPLPAAESQGEDDSLSTQDKSTNSPWPGVAWERELRVIDQGYVNTVVGQFESDSSTNATGTPGDQCVFSTQGHIC
jgi:hypothetical protein